MAMSGGALHLTKEKKSRACILAREPISLSCCSEGFSRKTSNEVERVSIFVKGHVILYEWLKEVSE
jgi:hypothetical protein